MPDLRVVIADDHEIFLDGLEALLKKVPDIEVVGIASNGRELLQVCREVNPDVVLTDIKMPLLDGIEATRQLTGEFPATGVIALSMSEEDGLIVEMLQAGAKGYLVKNAAKQEIIQAIHSVGRGQNYYCSRSSTKLIKLIAASRFNPHRKKEKPVLSEREITIIRLVCREYSNKEIADELGLSTRTVEGHRSRIEDKIGAKGTAGIVLYGIKNGLHPLG